jgi:NADPH-dependent glutamate synthase beta subunit-like oxidoreductase
MSKRELGDLEKRCIQEEPPTCMARCPIHVDIRTFLQKVAQGAWIEAHQVLARTMPFPGVLGRICDHPCQSVCRRAEKGDPIAIANLERAVVQRVETMEGQPALPKKNQRVAVMGGGLSSFTATLDLGRKGYQITLFEPSRRLGETLYVLLERALPMEIIEEELGILGKLGVDVRVFERIKDKGWLDTVRDKFNAVYVGLDTQEGSRVSPFRQMSVNPLTLASSKDGLFIGGERLKEIPFSPVGAVADGRRAATSIDRYLQKVSMTAERDREGPYETKLYTSLEGIVPRPVIPMEDKESGYSNVEAQREAGRCLQCECMECVKVCLFLERFKSYPKRYVRQIKNDETMVLGSHGQTIKLVNSCSLCDLCAVVCPHDLSMAQVCMEGRMSLAKRGKMSPSAHDLALNDMLSSNTDKASLALHEPGKTKSKFAFFPGCQMSAIYPEHVIATYSYLRNHLKGGTGLILRCCGAPAKWAVRNDLFEEALHGIEEDWEGMGRPEMIVACPTCHQVFKEHLPQVRCTTLWKILDDSLKGAQPGRNTFASNLAIHDPCTTRYEPDIQRNVRQLLTKMGVIFKELDLSRDKTECCGFGGLMAAANPSLAKDVAKTRGSRSKAGYVTYCAMCRNALASSGKQVLHILDLFFDGPEPSPSTRKALGHSERHENRYHLKQKLLKTLWGEKQRPMEEYEKIILHVSNDILERMEERRILREDVQKVIDHAEKTGTKLFNPETGRSIGSFRPAHITYWVEYTPEGDGFRVHNIYYHRMEVVEGGAQ